MFATPVKSEFFEISRRTLLKHTNDRMVEFTTKLQNALFVVLPHDALIAILKIPGTLTRNICDGVSFQYSYW